MPDAYPAQLLDDYVSVWRRKSPRALPATAIRTHSLAARRLLARAAAGSSASLERLLAAARGEDRARRLLEPSRLTPEGLGELARVIALQGILPDDHSDASALGDLALELFGADRIPPVHQGFHAQLAYHLGDRRRAEELLGAYSRVSDIVRSTLAADLANPFTGAGSSRCAEWLSLLESLMPECRLALSDSETLAPFDRLRATTGRPKVADARRISVIVTCYRPDVGLLTAVRSLTGQSWAHLEIVVVDDGSPAEHDSILRRCLSLDERIRLIRLGTNQGTYAARNAGMDASSGDFVTFLDSDDWMHPARLEQQIGPLVADPSLVATMSDMLKVTDELALTQPGRVPRLECTGTLMLRRDPVLKRLGYLDGVRKAADREYLGRIGAAFGSRAVRRLRGTVHLLRRERRDSLSHGELRGQWVHPARAAYWSAYALWHQRIRAGEASPYLPRTPPRRPFPAPARLSAAGADPSRRAASRTYDVVLASDWRPFGGPQKSMLEEIDALTGRGLRVGVMHMEAYRFMTDRHKPLCAAIQERINAGDVDQVLLTDPHRVSLLIVRYPPVLQFPPSVPSELEVGRVVILANQAPSELTGEDLRYVPEACTRAAEHLFSVRPQWAPQGPQVRDMLEARGLRPPELAAFDIPGIIDADEWCLQRTGLRSDVPVIGRHGRDNWTKWPKDRGTLLEVYPDRPDIDVRTMGGARVVRELLGATRLPGNWLAYDYDEVSVRSFLFQVDFWVHFPHPVAGEAFGRAILEALASGCVVILPHRFAASFGDAALYRHPSEVQETISHHHARPHLFLEQSRLAQRRVGEWFSHSAHFDLIANLLTAPPPPSMEARPGGWRSIQSATAGLGRLV